VVLLPFPNQAIRTLGFVTRDIRGASAFGDEATAMVFVPTTPNPTSGYLVIAKQTDLTVVNMSVEEGVKLVISGGLVTPARLFLPESSTPWIGSYAVEPSRPKDEETV
jgi:uncharacterized membrane protein